MKITNPIAGVAAPAAAPISDVSHAANKSFAASAGTPPGAAGQPLPADLRTAFETQFGQDFSDVRVHQGMGALHTQGLAFSQGSDLHFAPGTYDPHSTAGRELIGHELTHVVQQRAGRVGINDSAGLEAEADRLGARAARMA